MATTDFTNGVTLTDSAWFDDVDGAAYSVFSGVAGTNTVTATGPATYTYVSTRPTAWLTPVATNTGAVTLNVTPTGGAALGAKNVFYNNAALTGGELKAGVPVGLIYDGTQYQVLGSIAAATQAQQEAPTSTTVYVSPARQQFHPSAAKAWAQITSSGVLSGGYNVACARTTTGQYSITFTSVPMSSTNYALALGPANAGGTGNTLVGWSTKTVSSVIVVGTGASFTVLADTAFDLVVYGDQ